MRNLPAIAEDDPTALRAAWRETFQRFDADGNGVLSVTELQGALDDAGLPTSRTQVEALHKCMDLDGSGGVDFEEFCVFANRRRRALRNAFEYIVATGVDGDASAGRTPSFTAAHLRRASAKAGLPLSDRDVREIMSRADHDGDGFISFNEFVASMMLVPHINPHAFFDRWLFDDEFTAIARDGESFAVAAVRKVVDGGAAGVLSRTATAPLDRIRILMMTASKPIGIYDAYSRAISYPSGVGLRGLWRGNAINCIKIAPEMGIKLFSFDYFKSTVAADPHNVSMVERLVAGGCAGALSKISVYPTEVLRTRMATGSYSGFGVCVRSTLQTGGFGALYAGAIPTILGIIPYAAIDLAVNSVLRDAASAHLKARKEEVSVPLLLSCGMVSSATATVLTFPLNVVRTVAQATNTPLSEIILSLRAEGFAGFFRGVVPCLMKVMPATSISYASYEWLNSKWSANKT